MPASQPFTLLCIHGFTGGPNNFDRVLACLKQAAPDEAARLEVIAPALFGHAGCDAEGIDRFGTELARIAQLIEARPPQSVILLGYSMGGRMCFGLVLKKIPAVAAAIVIGAHPGIEMTAAFSERLQTDKRWIEMLETEGLEAFVNAWEAQPLFESQAKLAPELLAGQRAQRMNQDPKGLAAALRVLGLTRMPMYRTDLHDVKTPLVLMAGDQDAKFKALTTTLAREVPTSRPVIVPNVGHNLLLECPEVVAQAVLDTLLAQSGLALSERDLSGRDPAEPRTS